MYNFRVKMNLIKNYSFDFKSLSSIINAPILKNDKVIGIITNYDIATDEAIGCMYDDIIPNFNENNQIVSMEIL